MYAVVAMQVQSVCNETVDLIISFVFRFAAVVLLHVAIDLMLWTSQILKMNCKEGNLLIS